MDEDGLVWRNERNRERFKNSSRKTEIEEGRIQEQKVWGSAASLKEKVWEETALFFFFFSYCLCLGCLSPS